MFAKKLFMANWYSRTELLVGSDKFSQLSNSHVLIVGVGGVGGVAAEMLCRAGIGELTIVDADVVDKSNINRQLPATHETIGHAKVDVLAKRFLTINPDVKINVVGKFLDVEDIFELLTSPYDYIVDAIDTLTPKLFLIAEAMKKEIPIVSSMGAGGKLDPTQVQIADISKSHNCRLARMLRKRLKKFGIKKGFQVVFSPEEVQKSSTIMEESQYKKTVLGTMSFLPATFGCFCASVVVNHLLDAKQSIAE